jgi:hypothetical protein
MYSDYVLQNMLDWLGRRSCFLGNGHRDNSLLIPSARILWACYKDYNMFKRPDTVDLSNISPGTVFKEERGIEKM